MYQQNYKIAITLLTENIDTQDLKLNNIFHKQE